MKKTQSYLLVDGYNIIYAWEELQKISETSLEAARDKLVEILSNCSAVGKEKVIIVFDAHLVKGGIGSVIKHNNIKIIYTKEAQTADSYIEAATALMSKEYNVRVATSDGLEQLIILSHGAYRISAHELLVEVKDAQAMIKEKIDSIRPVKKNELISNLDKETAEWMEQMRLGKN